MDYVVDAIALHDQLGDALRPAFSNPHITKVGASCFGVFCFVKFLSTISLASWFFLPLEQPHPFCWLEACS